jgi:hypothetical protein
VAARRRWRGTTAQRGYGTDHQRLQRQLLAAWQPGDRCAHCGQPMWWRWLIDGAGRRVSAMHLAHNADRTAYIGLAHAFCNLSDGGQRAQAQRRTGWASSRRW